MSLNKNDIIKWVLAFQIIVVLVFSWVTSSVYTKEIKAQAKIINDMKDIQKTDKAEISALEERISLLETIQNDDRDQVWNELDYLRSSEEELKMMRLSVDLAALDNIEDKEEWFLGYKDIMERYGDYTGKPISIYEVYTPDEIYLIQRMVQTEVGNCSFEAKVHVADVVWNRLLDEKWPNTITQIITSPNQFAYGATSISESTKLAVEYSFMFPDETQGALGFHSGPKSETFGRYGYIFTDDAGHHFYGERWEK